MGRLQEEMVENHNKPQLTVAELWLELHPRSSRIQSRRVHAMAQADSCWPGSRRVWLSRTGIVMLRRRDIGDSLRGL